MDVYKWYRAERRLYERYVPVLPQLIKGAIRILWGLSLINARSVKELCSVTGHLAWSSTSMPSSATTATSVRTSLSAG